MASILQPLTSLNTFLFWAQVAHSRRNCIYLFSHLNATACKLTPPGHHFAKTESYYLAPK